ncbi:MAG: L-histidine N(alpha)-methyltransferase [Woeseiaceae bacterium]
MATVPACQPAAAADTPRSAFLADVLAGLSAGQKRLDPKYFYDERGSRLFGAITVLPEYYLTRTETGIMEDAAADIAAAVPVTRTIVEFGSGSGKRSDILLEALGNAEAYVPIDVSESLLRHTATLVESAHPRVKVHGLVADFTQLRSLPGTLPRERLGYFPGSTIGNFLPHDAVRFLRSARILLGRGARMLIGVDLLKAAERLERAYDDDRGVTEAFNKNLLLRINEELDGTFDPARFAHCAYFNERRSRVEMHLVSREDQEVRIDGEYRIPFRAGESIHTENSHKFTIDGFRRLAAAAGWQPGMHWVDRAGDFSVHLLEPAG